MPRYWDYNPSYSSPPGTPMDTPTTFENFVVPRAPQGINWPQPNFAPSVQGGRGPQTYSPPTRTRTTSRSSGPSPFAMMGMTDPSSWGQDSQLPPEWSTGGPRQISTQPNRQQFLSPGQTGGYDLLRKIFGF